MRHSTYHRISQKVTKHTRLAVYFALPVFAISIGTTVYGVTTGLLSDDKWLLLLISLMFFLSFPVIIYSSFFQFSYLVFEDNEVSFRLFNNKEIARYKKNDVAFLNFKEPALLKNLGPHIVIGFKDGKTIVFNREMKNFRSLADDIEEWTGLLLPDKTERLKNRTDRPINSLNDYDL